MTHMMNNVKDVCLRQHNKPIAINELLSQINKMDLTSKTTKDELKSVLSYYCKMQVLFVDQDD